jgi:cellulose biosynthesis protein BcsQ
MGKIYMTACMKGGCAKTVTTYNLAYSLQKLGEEGIGSRFR